MTRRVKRSNAYEITLLIKDDDFIRPPREMQRNTLINRALKEFSDDLLALDHYASDFVAGDLESGLSDDRTQKILSDDEIMEDWQIPILRAMAKGVCETHGEVLEIGFGRGVSASMIQQEGVSSHTIIECNDSVLNRYHQWKLGFPDSKIHLTRGLWQDEIADLGIFDGIFFHTYPLNQEEYMTYVHGAVTFAEHFFATAAKHLRPGGVFTYFSNEIGSLSRSHQHLLFQHFSGISLSLVDLDLPSNIKDTWWAKSMVIIKATK